MLGGLVGVTSACIYDVFKDMGEEDWVLIHCSQSCAILDKAVFSRSEYHKKRYDFKYVSFQIYTPDIMRSEQK